MNLIRYLAALVPAVILVACGQTATPAKITYPTESFAASSDTQAKTAVKLWNFQGAQTGLTVTGADSSGKAYHVLSITGEDANTFKIVQSFKNAAGELLASVSVLTHNDGTYSVTKRVIRQTPRSARTVWVTILRQPTQARATLRDQVLPDRSIPFHRLRSLLTHPIPC
jgi:hypothetical protein